MISEKTARKILETYEEAWVKQNTRKILSIFTKDGLYYERAFRKPFKGHKEIANYWKTTVLGKESEIKFKLLNYWIFDNNLIFEWGASFLTRRNTKMRIKGIIIAELTKNKIKKLREYWQVKE